MLFRSRIIPGQAEELLRQAQATFGTGDYPLARELAAKSETKARDLAQMHSRTLVLLEEIRRTHPQMAGPGALPAERADAAERAKKAFEAGDYGAAMELGERALGPSAAAGAVAAAPAPPPAAAAAPAPAPGLAPPLTGRLQKNLCPVCNRVFAIQSTGAVSNVTCPWCGATVQVGQG